MNTTQFEFWNRTLGWSVFAIALVTFGLTVEPTASFWDASEYIATSAKLQIGHPPGAPFFMLLGRFFTLFAGSPANAAKMVNVLSALSSSFTILFLFWTITHLLFKIFIKDPDKDLSLNNILIII